MGSLLERYEAFAVDLDGVVWRGEELLDGAAFGLDAIRKAKKRVLFLTNNASYQQAAVVKRLAAQGIEAGEQEVLNPAVVGIRWLTEHGLEGKRAFVLGERAVVQQFAEVIEVIPVVRGAQADVVIVARDTDFTFERLKAAADAVWSGAVLLAVNRDVAMPVEGGIEPGTGAILAAIEAAAAANAVVLGKPQPPMMEAAAKLLGTNGVLMIGDQPVSDVAGARLVGWDAAIVMTGLSAPGQTLLPAPDYILDSLREITAPVKPYA